MKVFKLYFKAPLRVGEAGIGLERTGEVIHSDTLFGAIVTALDRLNEDVQEFINKVRSGEIKFSSCFPFKDEIYYLPAPHLPIEKKWKFLTLKEFEKVISGEIPNAESKVDFIKKVEVPKVVLDRISSNSGIYYLTAIKFEGNSGLYFIADGNSKIKTALKYLQDEGIGGKRTWGLGKFKLKEDEIQIRGGEGSFYTTLSTVYPTNLSNIAYWKPIVRGGWINTKSATLRKPKVIVASEGSIFRDREEGEVVDLNIAYSNLSSIVGYNVYLNGKSFLIKMVMPDET